jgi:cell division protein ZapB
VTWWQGVIPLTVAGAAQAFAARARGGTCFPFNRVAQGDPAPGQRRESTAFCPAVGLAAADRRAALSEWAALAGWPALKVAGPVVVIASKGKWATRRLAQTFRPTGHGADGQTRGAGRGSPPDTRRAVGMRRRRCDLTRRYDQIILRHMDAELKGLEEKLNRFIELCHQLRVENQELRQTVAVKTDENKRLGEKIDEARRQIESLLSMIPE